MIDRIRQDIQHRLDQLMAEAEKLRHALAALDASDHAARPAAAPRRRAAAKAAAPETTWPQPTSEPVRARARRSTTRRSRTPRGATKSKVLEALASGNAMTATEVAKSAGLDRATVSTTLSKLSKSGEIAKADRGYRIAA